MFPPYLDDENTDFRSALGFNTFSMPFDQAKVGSYWRFPFIHSFYLGVVYEGWATYFPTIERRQSFAGIPLCLIDKLFRVHMASFIAYLRKRSSFMTFTGYFIATLIARILNLQFPLLFILVIGWEYKTTSSHDSTQVAPSLSPKFRVCKTELWKEYSTAVESYRLQREIY